MNGSNVTCASAAVLEETRKRWQGAFSVALEHDAWGQVEEAIESYSELEWAVTEEYEDNALGLSRRRRDSVGKFMLALRTRIQQLQSGEDQEGGLQGMRGLASFVQAILVSEREFPVTGVEAVGIKPRSLEKRSGRAEVEQDSGLLSPPKDVGWGDVTVSLNLEKWGFKKPKEFVKPRIVVSVMDGKGNYVEEPQETKLLSEVEGQYLRVAQTVHLQTPLNRFEDGYAVFFELQHYKAKKRKQSIKAYCFMELDEITPGPAALETYKKPTDFRRKKSPKLFTVKPLFLHLTITETSH